MSILLALCMCTTCVCRDQKKCIGCSRIGVSYEFFVGVGSKSQSSATAASPLKNSTISPSSLILSYIKFLFNFECSLNDAYETYLNDKT